MAIGKCVDKLKLRQQSDPEHALPRSVSQALISNLRPVTGLSGLQMVVGGVTHRQRGVHTGRSRSCLLAERGHSLFTGSTFCGDDGCAGAGSGCSSSFLLRMSQKNMRMRGTPHRNCSCLVIRYMDSLRLGQSRRQRVSTTHCLPGRAHSHPMWLPLRGHSKYEQSWQVIRLQSQHSRDWNVAS